MPISPLVKKLQIKEGYKILLLNPPDEYLESLGEITEYAEFVQKA